MEGKGNRVRDLTGNSGRTPRRPEAKVMPLTMLLERAEEWRRGGETIVFANGCFDLLHIGHITLLEDARREGERLVVAINSDASVRGLKGPTRPVVGEQERAQAALAPLGGAPFVACGPGTKMQSKDWGRENWRELLRRLSEQMSDRALVLVGAQGDFAVSEYAGAGWRGVTVNLCGELTPRETAAVLRNAELFLGPDSGPMHLAAAYGVPCAIAFAALDKPGVWFPTGDQHRAIYHAVECAQCFLTECVVQKKKCLTSISVEEMLAAAMAAVRGETARDKAVRGEAVRDNTVSGETVSAAGAGKLS